MLGVDTNVLVRFFTRDHEAEYELARRLVEDSHAGGLYVDPVVLVEFNWVLRRVYRVPRPDTLKVLDGLMEFKEFTIGNRDLVVSAINAAAATGCDFSDALIALLHEAAGCPETVTFDTKAHRLDQMVPVQQVLK